MADTSRWSVADALRSTRTRHDADANLGLTESRPASCDDHVAGERQLTATAQGIAFDRRNHGLAARIDGSKNSARVSRRMFAGVMCNISPMSVPPTKNVSLPVNDHAHVRVSFRCGKRLPTAAWLPG